MTRFFREGVVIWERAILHRHLAVVMSNTTQKLINKGAVSTTVSGNSDINKANAYWESLSGTTKVLWLVINHK